MKLEIWYYSTLTLKNARKFYRSVAIDRYQARNKKSYFFMAFSVSLNLFILFLLVPYIQILYASGGFLAFAFFIFVFRKIRESRSIKRKSGLLTGKTKPGFFDGLGLARKYFRINRKYTLASTVGLVLALLVISQTMLIGTSYRQDSFDQHILNNDTSALRFDVTSFDNVTYNAWEPFFQSHYQDWVKGSNLQLTGDYTEANILMKVMMGYSFTQTNNRSVAFTLPTTSHLWNQHIYDLLTTLPSFPGFAFNPNEKVLIVPPNINIIRSSVTYKFPLTTFVNQTQTGYQFRILADSDIHNDATPENASMFTTLPYGVDRIWQLSAEDLSYVRFNQIILPDGFTSSNLYLPKGEEWPLFNSLQDLTIKDQSEISIIWGDVGFSANLMVKIPQIIDMSLNDVQKGLQVINDQFLADYQSFIIDQKDIRNNPGANVGYYLHSYLNELIDSYKNNNYNLQQSMTFSSAPLLIVSLLLLFFSLSLIEKRKERLLSQMIIRGTSIEQMRGMLIFEIFISSVIASIVGMGISIPLSEIFMKSSGILQFNARAITLIIPYEWWWKVPALGILLAFDFNLINLYNVAMLEIEDSLSTSETKEAFWQRYNLDLYLFGICLLFWFVALLLPLPDYLAIILFAYAGPIVLGITIISVPLVIGRYFIDTLGKVLLYFKIKFDMMGLAIKNINTNKNFTSQLIALLLTGMMLSFMALVMSNTMTSVSQERSLYDLGAKITVENIDYQSAAQYDALFAPGVKDVTYVRYIQYNPGISEVPRGEKPDTWPNFSLFGIDPHTYANASFWKSSYSGTSLPDLMNKLEKTSNAAILPKTIADAYNLTIGDRYQFRYGNAAQKIYPFTLVGTVNVFPRLVTELPRQDNTGHYDIQNFYIITTLNNLFSIENQMRIPDMEEFVAYVNTYNNADVQWVADQINARMQPLSNSYEIKNYETEIIPFLQRISESRGLANQENRFLDIAVHSILLIMVIVNLIGVSYYSFVFIGDRQKELGIYRALGMTKNQILKLLFYEILLMVSTSIVFGLIAGSFLSYVSFLVIIGGGVNIVPPFSLVLPVLLIVGLSVLMTSVAMLMAFIPAWQNSKKQTGNVLRTQ